MSILPPWSRFDGLSILAHLAIRVGSFGVTMVGGSVLRDIAFVGAFLAIVIFLDSRLSSGPDGIKTNRSCDVTVKKPYLFLRSISNKDCECKGRLTCLSSAKSRSLLAVNLASSRSYAL